MIEQQNTGTFRKMSPLTSTAVLVMCYVHKLIVFDHPCTCWAFRLHSKILFRNRCNPEFGIE